MKSRFEIKKIGDVCEIKPPKKLSKEKLAMSDSVTFFPMKDLKEFNHYINPQQTKQLNEVYKGYVYFENNDVLLAKITPCFENGKLGIARGLENGVGFGSSEYLVFRPDKNILSDYLYYYLSQDFIRTGGKGRMTGAVGHKRIPVDYLSNQKLILPPIPEQKRIVAILDKAFAAIDKAKANAETNLINAKEVFESYLQSVFENKGEDWEEKRMGDVVDFFNGFAFKSKNAIEYSNTQVVRMGNLYQNKLSLDRKPVFYPESFAFDYEKYLLAKDDLIISLTGTTGKEDYGYAVKVPSTNRNLLLNQRIAKVLIKDNDEIELDFLFRYLHSRVFLDELYKTANGTRQANLSTATMKNLAISFPKSTNEQKQIVQRLEFLSAETKRLERIYQKKIDNLEELKKSILQKAFKGEL